MDVFYSISFVLLVGILLYHIFIITVYITIFYYCINYVFIVLNGSNPRVVTAEREQKRIQIRTAKKIIEYFGIFECCRSK